MDKAQIVLEIVLLLQGTPLAEFARQNFIVEGDRAAVRCATIATVASDEGELCKRSVATALQRFSYRFTLPQLGVLADLYVNALNRLEPEALARVRRAMCSTTSPEARRDAAAAQAVCDRLSQDF